MVRIYPSKHGKTLIFMVVYGVQRHFQQHSSYIMVVNIIGGGNRSTRRKYLSVASH